MLIGASGTTKEVVAGDISREALRENLPLEEIERVPEVLPDRDAEIVVYCMSPI